jgi:hypothetical protein
MKKNSRRWCAVVAGAGGWWFEDHMAGGEECVMWPDAAFGDSLLALYGVSPDETIPFEAALQVHIGKRAYSSVDYCDEPWLRLVPKYEDIKPDDGVDISMGMVYHAFDAEGNLVGVIPLCWEGLIKAFGVQETGELVVYPARYARVPAVRVAIEEDYA